MSKKCLLIIMDGWGHGKNASADAIKNANTPFVDSLYNQYPNSELITCGEQVGLPAGQMGNSEVGHLNLGAGRIVYQELERINVAIRTKELFKNAALIKAVTYAKENDKPLHLMGLVSDGGVHSHIEHLIALCNFCNEQGLDKVFIHAFTDGRDTDPESGLGFIEQLEKSIKGTNAKIATITGRFYAMDRDKRWERVKLAYDNMVHGNGTKVTSATNALKQSYSNGVTDEFLKPITIVVEKKQALATIQDGDAVLCFNFRTDRCREITEVLTQQDMPEHNMHKLSVHYSTMTEYDKTYKGINVLFTNENLKNTLGEVLAANGKTQIRMAETEKYPHVTFFFSGGRETEFEGEKRMMKASPQDVLTYDLKPEMSAYELTEALLPELKDGAADFVCLNFANADMVGHTGVWEAAIKAAETVDKCVGKIVTEALNNDYAIFLTADHGNSDLLINEDGTPNTAHTLNPVPLFFISNEQGQSIKDGKLADIAPSILNYMSIDIPSDMTGKVLFNA